MRRFCLFLIPIQIAPCKWLTPPPPPPPPPPQARAQKIHLFFQQNILRATYVALHIDKSVSFSASIVPLGYLLDRRHFRTIISMS